MRRSGQKSWNQTRASVQLGGSELPCHTWYQLLVLLLPNKHKGLCKMEPYPGGSLQGRSCKWHVGLERKHFRAVSGRYHGEDRKEIHSWACLEHAPRNGYQLAFQCDEWRIPLTMQALQQHVCMKCILFEIANRSIVSDHLPKKSSISSLCSIWTYYLHVMVARQLPEGREGALVAYTPWCHFQRKLEVMPHCSRNCWGPYGKTIEFLAIFRAICCQSWVFSWEVMVY